MRLFILGILLVLPLSAFAQSTSPIAQGGTITVIPTPLGYVYALPHGGSVEVIGKAPAQQSYTARDGTGHITTGMIFSPFAPLHEQSPLTVPDLSSATHGSIKALSDARHEAFETLYGR